MSASSSETNPVDALVDLIDGADPGTWRPDAPAVYRFEEIPQSEKAPADGEPANIYVWHPTEGEIRQFDAENTAQLEFRTVECQIYDLDPGRVMTYQRDLVQFLSAYARDNYALTEYHQIRPTNIDDLRAETPSRQTDAYLATVSVETQNYQETGVVN